MQPISPTLPPPKTREMFSAAHDFPSDAAASKYSWGASVLELQ